MRLSNNTTLHAALTATATMFLTAAAAAADEQRGSRWKHSDRGMPGASTIPPLQTARPEWAKKLDAIYTLVSSVSILSSGRVGCSPQHRQRQPQARPGGFSVHHELQPHELHAAPGGVRWREMYCGPLSARTVTPRAASASIPPKRAMTAWLTGSSAAKLLPSSTWVRRDVFDLVALAVF
jgi:hypothetical protein